MNQPVITVVICTKDRAKGARTAAESVLRCDHPSFRLLVIDQSADNETQLALSDLIDDERSAYVRSAPRGLSHARNEGLRLAESELVAFTDDDCEVPRDWLTQLERVMNEHLDVTLAFCKVEAGPHDPRAGFVPSFECEGTLVFSGFDRRLRGMGAGLVVRREETLALGGFDEQLGVGARFASCEDRDLMVRILLAGGKVCTTDRTFTVHHGFRSWSEGKALAKRDFVGIGAACVKPLRAGHWCFVLVTMYELLVESLWPPISNLLHLRPPLGKARAFHFMRGFIAAATAPLSREQLVFLSGEAQLLAGPVVQPRRKLRFRLFAREASVPPVLGPPPHGFAKRRQRERGGSVAEVQLSVLAPRA